MRGRAVGVLCPLLLAACAAEPAAWPAVGWVNGVTVRLADDSPGDAARSVAVTCPPSGGCSEPSGGSAGPVGVPLRDGAAEVHVGMGTPDAVLVTVLDDAAEALQVHEAALDWVRVGGTEECGGPHAADPVVVPAP